MKRIQASLWIAVVWSLGLPACLAAQELSADRFLEGVAVHSVGDQTERDQSVKAYQALNSASAAEVKRTLPSILNYTRSGNELHLRGYAVTFLLGIAIRPDGADLLSSSSEEISSLIVDSDPGIQNTAVAITDWVIEKAGAHQQQYVSALRTAIETTQTPQNLSVGMVLPLLHYGSSDPATLKAALAFMHRDDLTVSTRIELVHDLGNIPGLPKEVNQALCRELDDPDPRVRAATVAAFADSNAEYHSLADDPDPKLRAAALAAFGDPTIAFQALAHDRIERMASDAHENPQVRELAKQAIAGKSSLNPNVDMPPDHPTDR